MPTISLCCVPGCDKRSYSKGMCNKHYRRVRKFGDPNGGTRAPRGARSDYLQQVVLLYAGDECLIWPFGKPGYSNFNLNGRSKLVHRYVCEVTNGDPPSPEHEAAHSCGNGHLGCVAPNHLRWATPKENCADTAKHGRANRGEKHYRAKLTADKVIEIRKLIAAGVRRKDIAKRFDLKPETIDDIRGRRSWAWL